MAYINALERIPSYDINERHKNDILASKRTKEQLDSFILDHRRSEVWRMPKIEIMEKNVFRSILLPRANFRKEKIRSFGLEHPLWIHGCWFRHIAKPAEDVPKWVRDDTLLSLELYGCWGQLRRQSDRPYGQEADQDYPQDFLLLRRT